MIKERVDNSEEVLRLLKKIIYKTVNKKLSREEVAEGYLDKLMVVWDHNVDYEFMISDCYYGLMHIFEEKYETSYAEIMYFYE